jgi:hypothetical protein
MNIARPRTAARVCITVYQSREKGHWFEKNLENHDRLAESVETRFSGKDVYRKKRTIYLVG